MHSAEKPARAPSAILKNLIVAIIGAILGGLVVGAFCFLHMMGIEHHYREIDAFFHGTVEGQEVLGISYFEYTGIGFMEGNQWKILLKDPWGGVATIYQNHSMFQEVVPGQPHIEIKGSEILIDDGWNKLKVLVHPLPPLPPWAPTYPDQAPPAPGH